MSLDLDLNYPKFNLKGVKYSNNEIYEFEGFRLDAATLMLSHNDAEVSLAPKAVETLLALVERRGKIVSKDELIETIWADSIVEESNLAQYLHVLRKTLGHQKNGKPFIETLRRRGYRFSAEVRAIEHQRETFSPVTAGIAAVGKLSGPERSAYQIERQGNVLAVAGWKRPDAWQDGTGDQVEPDTRPVEENEPAPRANTIRNSWILMIIFGFLAASLAGSYLWRQNATPSTNDSIDSVAVLPFVNNSSDPQLDYLSDGLSEGVIDRLSGVAQLRVIARDSSFKFRGQDVDLREAAAKLGARAIVTGRFSQDGDSLHVRAEMIDVRSDRQLWSGDFDQPGSDTRSIQAEIAGKVSEKLRLRLSRADTERLARNYTENGQAYQLYLQGHFLRNKISPSNVYKSIELHQQAIALDPNFALAYVGLAEAMGRMSNFIDVPKNDYEQKVREYTLKALSLDDRLAEAHATLGGILSMRDYDFPGAEREYDRALELNPNYADAHVWRGQLLSILGRHDEALAEIQRGLDLDPISLEANQARAEGLFFARHYDESIDHLQKMRALDDNYLHVHRFLAFDYEMKGEYAARIEEGVKINEIGGTKERADAMRSSFQRGGWPRFLRDGCDDKFDQHPSLVAAWCAELGNKDKAIEILEKLYSERSYSLIFLKVDPRLDNLRDDPRFQDLVDRVGFPQ